MRAVQILMDEGELRQIDKEARRRGTDRSKLVREAMRRYLLKLAQEADERQYIESYRREPQDALVGWEKVQAWPED
jgi:metal-responsive CopG/Arc/MetJ family transcriptional regulator